MSITIHAHFDGAVIVPDEPVELPIGERIEIEIRQMNPEASDLDLAARKAALQELISRGVKGLNISDESLRRENLYEDRL